MSNYKMSNDIFKAVENDDAAAVERIIASNPASVHQLDNMDETPLQIAAANSNIDIVRLLIDNGADLNKGVPFLSALTEDDLEIADLLLERGADINARTDEYDENTALHWMTARGSLDSVRYLVEHGADVNARNIRGQTPLFYTFLNEIHGAFYDVATYLLEHGADINAVDNDGRTMLKILQNYGNYDASVEFLMRHGARALGNNNNENNNYNGNNYNSNSNNYNNEMPGLRNITSNVNNKALVQIALPIGAPTKCFDPIMANSNVNITPDMTTFYIMNDTNTIKSSACLDEDSLNKYKTLKEYLFFRCKDTVPVSALHITERNVKPGAIRLLNLDIRIYVKDAQVQQLKYGKKYILKPVGNLGRIVSYKVIAGGSLVGSVHCGPDDGSKLYEILEVTEPSSGGRRNRKATRKTRNRKATRKTRNRKATRKTHNRKATRKTRNRKAIRKTRNRKATRKV